MFKKCKVVHSRRQHLYILSDEEIKEGDWYMSSMDTIVSQHNGTEKLPDGWKKIISTTDKSLIIGVPQFINGYLPKPSQAFIEKHVEEYNKGNVITEVMVEYEEFIQDNGNHDNYTEYKLKINPKDNTITIRKVKDSWSREEVIKLCFQSYNLRSMDKEVRSSQKMYEWLEENL